VFKSEIDLKGNTTKHLLMKATEINGNIQVRMEMRF
jgi:hypothetical protein